jgi:hypothetical protein
MRVNADTYAGWAKRIIHTRAVRKRAGNFSTYFGLKFVFFAHYAPTPHTSVLLLVGNGIVCKLWTSQVIHSFSDYLTCGLEFALRTTSPSFVCVNGSTIWYALLTMLLLISTMHSSYILLPSLRTNFIIGLPSSLTLAPPSRYCALVDSTPITPCSLAFIIPHCN